MSKLDSLGKSPFTRKRNSEGGLLSPAGHIFKRMSRSQLELLEKYGSSGPSK